VVANLLLEVLYAVETNKIWSKLTADLLSSQHGVCKSSLSLCVNVCVIFIFVLHVWIPPYLYKTSGCYVKNLLDKTRQKRLLTPPCLGFRGCHCWLPVGVYYSKSIRGWVRGLFSRRSFPRLVCPSLNGHYFELAGYHTLTRQFCVFVKLYALTRQFCKFVRLSYIFPTIL